MSLPSFVVVGYAFYSVGIGMELLVWAVCQVGLLIAAWIWIRKFPEEGAVRMYSGIEEVPVVPRDKSQFLDHFESPVAHASAGNIPVYKVATEEDEGVEFENVHLRTI